MKRIRPNGARKSSGENVRREPGYVVVDLLLLNALDIGWLKKLFKSLT